MAEMMQHLTALADEIGPRPATSDAEHQAASYLEAAFVARGLEPEVQEFESPRTYAWAFVLYHLLTIVSAVIAGAWLLGGMLVWLGFAVSAITAFFLWSDLDTHWGLTRIMPKGPSQNVIARHVPKARRGERMKRVVIVAHYDSARASLAFSPGMVKRFPVTFTLMKVCTFAVPVLLLAQALPIPWPTMVVAWPWYAAMIASAYLLVPLFIYVQSEIGMPFVAGAGDNASGVAAMLGVLHNLVPEPDMSRFSTSQFPVAAVRRSPDIAYEAGVVPDGSLLSYPPAEGGDASTRLPEDFAWVEPEVTPPSPPVRGRDRLPEFETIEFSAVGGELPPRSSAPVPAPPPAPAPAPEPARTRGLESDWAADAAEGLGATGSLGVGEPARTMDPSPERPPKRRFLGGLGRKKREETPAVEEWLGVDQGFDAREEGKNIGSWDNFGGSRKPVDDDDDEAGGLGWKGGWAGDDPIEDQEFAANEAARIRRRVTEDIDRDLVEKEVWFVATGAEEVGTVGMQAFLAAYGDELRDALIINLDNVGAGQLSWVTDEGMARRYRANARLIGLAKRVSRDCEILVKPRSYKGLSTDATPALARGFKALTLMGFDSAGLPINWHWKTDTSDQIEPEVVERTTELVTQMIREA